MLDERLARLRAEKDRLLARAGKAERRRDTRRKIVLGGTVLAALEHEGVPAPSPVAAAGAARPSPLSMKATGALWRFFETPCVPLWPR
jgi:hypothetical protein